MTELPVKLLPDVPPVIPKPPLKEVPLKEAPTKDVPPKLLPVKLPLLPKGEEPAKPPPKDDPVEVGAPV